MRLSISILNTRTVKREIELSEGMTIFPHSGHAELGLVKELVTFLKRRTETGSFKAHHKVCNVNKKQQLRMPYTLGIALSVPVYTAHLFPTLGLGILLPKTKWICSTFCLDLHALCRPDKTSPSRAKDLFNFVSLML